MRIFLEVKGKLGPIPQSLSNQYRPPQPDTNPNFRKATKTTEKRKRVAPTKRFKANTATKPNSNGATAQPPTTISKAPNDLKIRHLHKKKLQKVDSHHQKMPQSMQVPHRPMQEKCWETFLRQEKDWLLLPII